MFIKDRPVSSLGVFAFEFLGSSFSSFWVLRFRDLDASFTIGAFRFRDLGASFSSFGCFVFEIWVLCASVFVFGTTHLFCPSEQSIH